LVKLQRHPANPILKPHPDHPWEDLAVFNPAAWYDEERQEVLLLYRAAESHPEYKCYFGLATSTDGVHFERVSDKPVIGPSVDAFDASTIQDPRMVKMGDTYFITYACRHYPFGQFWVSGDQRYRWPESPPDYPRFLRENATSTGLLLTRDFKDFVRAGRLTDPMLDDRDVVLFPEKIGGRYWMMHRPLEWTGPEHGTEHPAVWIADAEDMMGFRNSRLLITAQYDWENGKIGINTPPIRTERGWLTLYHAVGADGFYRLGALLLDLEDPGRVMHRSADWLMQPEADYEIEGFYRGCVFPCGKVVIDGTLYVYYGGADKFVGLATCPLNDLLDTLVACPPS
jgi:predicted GH43/DUF377 family glycosyl hydrolase